MIMLTALPQVAMDVMDWEWVQFQPHFDELAIRPINGTSVGEWLSDWTHVSDLITEVYARRAIATTLNTQDEAVRDALHHFLEHSYQPAQEAAQRLKQKLLESGLEPEGFAIPLRNMRAEADLFRQENLPLFTEDHKQGLIYDQLIGALTVTWGGEEITLTQLVVNAQKGDRPTREQAWRLGSQRMLADRQKINENWQKLWDVRRKMADNAGKTDFRSFMWQAKLRFDYTPEDAEAFHRAIEQVAVPAARRVYERRRAAMGVETLRPWDIGVDVMRNTDFTVDPHGREPLHPFKDVEDLASKGEMVFDHVDPQLGEQFKTMRRENLLDLPNYKGKAPGAYCDSFPTLRRPFVFMNAVGSSADVSTLLHEVGHAFHVFAAAHLPYHQLHDSPMEFSEVASMAMELLGSPFLKNEGGFFTPQEYARALIEHLEGMLVFWPYMAVVDGFNHWAHTHAEGRDPSRCDAKWDELWDRFIQGPDWSGLDDEKVTGWHRKLHIHRVPFYYIEYGLAQLGAAQVWANALTDQTAAVAAYRTALSLGGSVTLPELYATAGVKFALDADTLKRSVDLMEAKIEELGKLG
jgi:oligoendopeptidase F